MAESAPFFWGSGGEKLSQDQITRRRKLAEALVKGGVDYSPVQHWTQGAARVAQALLGGYEEGKLDRAEKANAAEDSKIASGLISSLMGGGAAAAPAPAAPSMAGDGAARTMAMPAVAPELKDGIVQTANALGIAPVDLATAISYETGGTFNPTQAGPRTKWGQHRGLIQFGEPQAREHGVDWGNPVASQLGPNGAVASYLRTAGVKPGMGLLDVYSAINAGAPGLYDRSDAAAGGAPGTVRDKVEKQMAGHRAKALALLGNAAADLPAPGASPVSQETGQTGFAIPPGAQPAGMTGQQFNAIHGNEPVQPVFQSEGIGQPWMGTALPPAQPSGPTMVAAPMPPARPAGLAMPQADLPAPGAVPAMGQLPAPPQEDLSNAPGAGAREGIVQALMAQQGQAGPAGMVTPPAAPRASPVPPSAPPAAQQVAQTVAQNPNDPIVQALTNPAASEGTRKIALALLQKRISGNDTRGIAMGDRLVDPKTGRVIADFSNGGKSTEFGLAPIYGTDSAGNPAVVQLGKRGDAKLTQLPQGFKIARDAIRVDGPTGTTLLDPQTRQQVGFIPKDLAGAERAKIEGKAQGEAQTGLGQAIATAEQSLATIDNIRKHPGRFNWGATGASADWPIIGGGLGGTQARDFVVMVDQLKGKSFLEAFESLKGGGQITETEGAKATAAIARLDRAQTRQGFDAALSDLESVIKAGMERAKKKAGGQSTAPQIDTTKPGNYRFNPATGKMEPA